MNKPSEELLADLLPDEKVYPVYRIHPKWTQDIGTINTENMGPNWFKDLPAGRMHSSKCWYDMPKDDQQEQRIITEANETWWPKYIADPKHEIVAPADLVIAVEFLFWETWAMSWFKHWTWDTGQDRYLAIRSFGRYVDRMQSRNLRERKQSGGMWSDPYNLMGAEEHFRWCGAKDADGDPTEAPCRCEHCVRLGVITINH